MDLIAKSGLLIARWKRFQKPRKDNTLEGGKNFIDRFLQGLPWSFQSPNAPSADSPQLGTNPRT
jgi:hypothetical protein